MSYWNIRCLSKECGEPFPSHLVDGTYKNGGWFGGLQWKRDGHGEIIEETIRLHCPHCNTAHTEQDLHEMNKRGEYISDMPNRTRHKSYQFGWAAGFRSRSFIYIAEERMKLAENDTYTQQLSFDNNVRGLPHQSRRRKAASNKILEGHCVEKLIDPDELSATFLISDTQDSTSVWTLTGIDDCFNDHVLAFGIEDLLIGIPGSEDGSREPTGLYWDVWHRFYGDFMPTLMMIDEGGNRSDEVCELVRNDNSGGLYTYKGNPRRSHYEKDSDDEDDILFPGGKNFSRSDNDSWRILADPKWYHNQLLHRLYAMENKGSNYIFFPPASQCTDQFFKQILAQRPPKNSPDARFEKWNAGTHDERVDDYFDCLKMHLVLKDFAKKYMELGGDGWRKPMPWMEEYDYDKKKKKKRKEK